MLKRLLLELMSEGINVSFHFDKQRQMVKVHLHKLPYHAQAEFPFTVLEHNEGMARILVNSAKHQLNAHHHAQD